MDDKYNFAEGKGTISDLLDGVIKDQVNRWSSSGFRDGAGVTSEVIALTKRVLARTILRLEAEHAAGRKD